MQRSVLYSGVCPSVQGSVFCLGSVPLFRGPSSVQGSVPLFRGLPLSTDVSPLQGPVSLLRGLSLCSRVCPLFMGLSSVQGSVLCAGVCPSVHGSVSNTLLLPVFVFTSGAPEPSLISAGHSPVRGVECSHKLGTFIVIFLAGEGIGHLVIVTPVSFLSPGPSWHG